MCALNDSYVRSYTFDVKIPQVGHRVRQPGSDRNFLSRPNMSLVLRKPVFGVSDQVRKKMGRKTTEDT